MELYDGFDSNYRFVLVAARRARQLQNGAQPRVETLSHKPCRIAAQEVLANKIDWSIPAKEPVISSVELAEPLVQFAGDHGVGEE
jgi:DNA-directed RNA polymerase subunit omega